MALSEEKSLRGGFDEGAVCSRVFSVIGKQKDFAAVLGISATGLSERKRAGKCTLDMVVAASELSGRSIEWLLFGSEAKERDVGGLGVGGPPRVGYNKDKDVDFGILWSRIGGLERRVARLEGEKDEGTQT